MDAVEAAYKLAEKGDAVLLSPACAVDLNVMSV